MKKDIRYILVGAAIIATGLASCARFQEEDLFEESPALRIEHNSAKLQDILVNAPQGWVMQYYTGDGVSVFEGFNLFAKFEKSGKVILAGDHRFLRDGNAGKYTEATSLYELIREDGLVLAFNTWNDVLTPFVDPVAHWKAPNELLKDGEGMQGDQNLVVTSMKEDELIFRGERYDAEVRMVKADRDWQTYLSDTEAMKKRVTSDKISTYYVMADNDTLYCEGLRDGRYRLSERIKDYVKNDSASCCFTPTGFRNEKVDTLAGHIFQEFKLNEDGSALVNEDGKVRIFSTWDIYMADSTYTMWLDKETMSADVSALCDQLDAALKTIKSTYVLDCIGIGESQEVVGMVSVNGLVVQWRPSKRAKAVRGGLALKRKAPAMGQLTFTCADNAKFDDELKGLKKPAVEDAVRQLGAALAGTYQMIPNNCFNPTSIQFQRVDGETTFNVSSE